MQTSSVSLKNIPTMLVVSRRITIPTNNDVPKFLPPAIRSTWNYVKLFNGKVAGKDFTIWHQGADVVVNEIVEIVLPLEQVIPQSNRYQVYDLPEALVASAVHHGDFEEFTRLHTTILQWVKENGYEIEGNYREIYIHHDPNNYGNSTTEVQYPLKERSGE